MSGILSAEFNQHFPIQTVFDHQPSAAEGHIRSAMARGLKQLAYEPWRDEVLTVAGTGPSLEETWREMRPPIVTGNGGVGWLVEHGITPDACAAFDPRPHLADLIVVVPGVKYYIAATCHPTLFDKLIAGGAEIILWFPDGERNGAKVSGVTNEALVPGASTIGLRWIDIGCVLGFHRFALHGMDSSFRLPDGQLRTHAHPDHADGALDHVSYIDGYPTGRNMIEQVRDFFSRLPVWQQARLTIKVHGTGLLQHYLASSPHRDLLANQPAHWPCD